VVATLNDPAELHDKNLVCAPYRGEAVGDDEAGASRQQAPQRILDHAFGGVVHARSRLVEDKDRRILEQRAGDGEALLFAYAELHTTLAKFGMETLRQSPDKGLGIGGG